MTRTKLTWYWKVRDQIDTIEILGIKLEYNIKDRDQICSLPKNKLKNKKNKHYKTKKKKKRIM